MNSEDVEFKRNVFDNLFCHLSETIFSAVPLDQIQETEIGTFKQHKPPNVDLSQADNCDDAALSTTILHHLCDGLEELLDENVETSQRLPRQTSTYASNALAANVDKLLKVLRRLPSIYEVNLTDQPPLSPLVGSAKPCNSADETLKEAFKTEDHLILFRLLHSPNSQRFFKVASKKHSCKIFV